MNIRKISATLIGILFSLTIVVIGEGSLPYNAVNKTLVHVETKQVNEKEFGAFYMKPLKDGDEIDLQKANFRVETQRGNIVPLECEVLSETPEEELSNMAKKMMAIGFSYRIWIPRNDKEFTDGKLRHSLPRGMIKMGTEHTITVAIPLVPKQNDE